MAECSLVQTEKKPVLRPFQVVAMPACIAEAARKAEQNAQSPAKAMTWVGNCGCTCLCPGT